MKLQETIIAETQKYYKNLERIIGMEDFALFHALIGEKYPEGEKEGIMFYGRATNGWNQDSAPDTSFVLSYMQSSFFRLMRYIYTQYYNIDNDDWTKYVGYSNIAKVAPEDGGNPNEEWWDLQYKDILEILKVELTKTSPKVAIFVTGNTAGDQWDAPLFFDGGMYNGKKDSPKANIVWDTFITTSGEYRECTASAYLIDGTIVIITDRPEFRNMENHVSAIMDFIRNPNLQDLVSL